MTERISVIIPTYNRETFISRTVESALKQTWKNVEVIVIDDGSNDNTGKVLESFMANPFFHYFHQENKGRSVARNEGLRLSTGDWVMWLDSDDYLLPDALEKLYQLAMEAGDSTVVFANFLFTDSRQGCYGHDTAFNATAFNKNLLMEVLNTDLWLTKTGTYLVKRDLAQASGGFVTSFEPSEDLDYTIRLLMKSKASYTSDVVLHVERHNGNTNERDTQQAIIRICRYYLAQMNEWRGFLSNEEIEQARFNLRSRIAHGSYEVDKHGDALLYYSKMIGARPSLVFDKFIFKQFFASLIPPGFKKTMKRSGRQQR